MSMNNLSSLLESQRRGKLKYLKGRDHLRDQGVDGWMLQGNFKDNGSEEVDWI